MRVDHTKDRAQSVAGKEVQRQALAKEMAKFGEKNIQKIPQGQGKDSKGRALAGAFEQTPRYNKAMRRRQIAKVVSSESIGVEAVYLSTQAASKALGLAGQALERARASGKLVGEVPPQYEIEGGQCRYAVKELNRWLINFKYKHQHKKLAK